MKFNKKGAINISEKAKNVIYMIVFLVVIFKLFASMLPEAQTAGQELNDSGVPFGTFFLPSGIVFILVMVGLFLSVLSLTLPKK